MASPCPSRIISACCRLKVWKSAWCICTPIAVKRDAERPRYAERLEFEINTILKMGFPGYFLIVGDFINWAKKNGCPVGPGRGSGAGSLVAYSLKITDLDPLQYNLLFERFLESRAGLHARLRH